MCKKELAEITKWLLYIKQRYYLTYLQSIYNSFVQNE